MHKNKSMALLLGSAIALLPWLPAVSEPYFDEGVRLYGKGDYKGAQAYFTQAIKSSPGSRQAYYYEALCRQQAGDLEGAKEFYKKVYLNFSGSPEAEYSAGILKQLDPPFIRQQQRAPAGASVSAPSLASEPLSLEELKSLPDEAKIPFTRAASGHLFVDSYINGRPLRIMFDTGASVTAVGRNHLERIAAVTQAGGTKTNLTGSTGRSVAATVTKAEVKVGPIKRTVPITVMDYMPTEPLLGENFFSAFTYEIDNQGGFIHFVKKSSSSAQPYDAIEIPFTKVGNNFQVIAEVNGKSCPMLFDTGASLIVFPLAYMALYGVKATEDNTKLMAVGGIDGVSRAYQVPVERIKLGPILKTNIPVIFSENAGMFPLLGQPFFGDRRYSIDNEKHVIRFWR